ncbi:permease [Nocardioides sp.]|uniref:permease n=1 Tax=Nocardioides sp. TaxID=35761 RepID=UPI0039E5F1B5
MATLPPRTAAPRSALGQPEIVAALVIAILLGQRWIVPLFDHEAIATWCTIFTAIVVQSMPFLVGGVLLSALIATVVTDRLLGRIVPRNPVLAVPAAGIAGMGLPGCECAAVPIAGRLIGRGVAPGVALTFLLASPAINPAVLISTVVAFGGRVDMMAARFAASLATAVLVGWWCVWRGDRLRLRSFEGEGTAQRFAAAVRHDFLHAAGFLVLGAMLAAAVNTFLPRSVVNTVAEHPALAVLAMAALAFVVALCSESDAFVAASFTSFSDTAKLVFLVVGPAMDLKLAALEAGRFGTGFALRFVPLVVVVAAGCAVLAGWVLL